MKERIYSRDEGHGNAIVTFFLGASVPTGKNGNGSYCAVVTPTVAAGKGFRLLAITSTVGGSLPISNSAALGHTMGWNNAVQYRLDQTGFRRFLWPEIEINSSFFRGGSNDGKQTVFITPGAVLGRIPLTHPSDGKPGQLGLTVGAGEQIALTHFHANNHNVILTVRLPF